MEGQKIETTILVVGAGPVGLSAALFLSYNGITPRIIDKLPERVIQSRALVINHRTLALFGKYGLEKKLIPNSYRLEGANVYKNNSRLTRLDMNKVNIDNQKPMMIVQEQAESERALTLILNNRNIFVERGTELLSIKNSEDVKNKVEVELKRIDRTQTELLRFDYVFCADGAHSIARKSLGLEFIGHTYNGEPWSLYDLRLDTKIASNELHMSLRNGNEFVFLARIKEDIWRIFSNSLDVFNELPKDSRVKEIIWDAKYRISHRVISKFNVGNIFFGGDAAHVHAPLGGRGMNLGIEDAFVFTELLILNRLNEYDELRGKSVRNTVKKIHSLTDRIVSNSFSSRILRALSRLLLPLLFPFIKKHILRFITGLDHELGI